MMRSMLKKGMIILFVWMMVLGGTSGILGGSNEVAAAGNDWVYCAGEGAYCHFTGEKLVRYGIDNNVVYARFTDGVSCDTATFAQGDPAPGVVKQCEYWDEFAGGNGTQQQPFEITSAKQLDNVRNNMELGLYFKLSNDIDLNVSPYNEGDGWQPIGSDGSAFRGNIDGNGHIIRGLTIRKSTIDFVGLFGQLELGSTVTNMRLENVNITGNWVVGGLAGHNRFGSISNSYVTGTVNGNHAIGGLVGFNDGTITNSYASASVIGNVEIGGLVGVNMNGTITTSYATGIVSGTNQSGGLVGVNNRTITNSYYNNGSSHQDDTGKGTGLTVSEMKMKTSFNGWNFASDWFQLPNEYPQLWAFTTLTKGTNPGTTKLNNTRNGMEYSVKGSAYIPITGTSTDNIIVNVGDTISIRDANDVGNIKTIMVKLTDINSPSSNALLSNINVKQSTLTPGFEPSNVYYSVDVPNEILTFQFELIPADPYQTIAVTGAVRNILADNEFTYGVPNLVEGNHTIQITVSAQDGSIQNYQVFVNHLPIVLADLNDDGDRDIVDVLLTMKQREDQLSRGQIEQLLQQIIPKFIELD
ncbi:GLUG motif-containing protein [Paenibacillus plantarum]|nr:GLUG motif-containing protein [Paenibacillus plantarum]